MQTSCIDQFDAINCRAAVNFCDNELSTGMWASGSSNKFSPKLALILLQAEMSMTSQRSALPGD
jgi:hypothetical protein